MAFLLGPTIPILGFSSPAGYSARSGKERRGGLGGGRNGKEKKEEGEVRTRNRTERNGTERIQTDRIVSDRITGLHGGERTDRDQNGW